MKKTNNHLKFINFFNSVEKQKFNVASVYDRRHNNFESLVVM
jgi:hypothetical protein